MDPSWLHGLLEKLALVIVLVLSLSVHEWAHAFSAALLGDDTAKRLGRLTLNPASHIDPVGTLLLPLLGIPFGWAKPVPVNPARFTTKLGMSTGMMITAAAGPFSNLVLALTCALLYTLIQRFALQQPALMQLLEVGFFTNVALAVFNMLPVPPLDGSRVAEGLMPLRMRPTWERFARFGPLVLIVIMLLPQMGIHVLNWPMHKVANGLLYMVQLL
jgi:Zn-dependent protease